mmetsp:Transcript_25269/g.60391  ORF Transcript_25269/g.60391 Transcript_25269/m.60391 type:complete len:230 (+) Transcript_25269:152-841(+)
MTLSRSMRNSAAETLKVREMTLRCWSVSVTTNGGAPTVRLTMSAAVSSLQRCLLTRDATTTCGRARTPIATAMSRAHVKSVTRVTTWSPAGRRRTSVRSEMLSTSLSHLVAGSWGGSAVRPGGLEAGAMVMRTEKGGWPEKRSVVPWPSHEQAPPVHASREEAAVEEGSAKTVGRGKESSRIDFSTSPRHPLPSTKLSGEMEYSPGSVAISEICPPSEESLRMVNSLKN